MSLALRGFVLMCGLVIVYTFDPFHLYSSLTGLTTAVAPAADPSSLATVIRNTTNDFDHLTLLLQEFFTNIRVVDNSTEGLFRSFMHEKASRGHRQLEYFLDWILGLYKFAWPFLLVYAVVRLTAKTGEKAGEALVEEVPRRPSQQDSSGSLRDSAEYARRRSHGPARVSKRGLEFQENSPGGVVTPDSPVSTTFANRDL